MTTVNMRKLSMPAHGHAMEKLAVAWVAGFVAVSIGMVPSVAF